MEHNLFYGNPQSLPVIREKLLSNYNMLICVLTCTEAVCGSRLIFIININYEETH